MKHPMVFASFCEHASSVFIFASTSCCQILLESSEHLRKIQMASSEHFEYFVNFPEFEIFFYNRINVLRQVIANNLTPTKQNNS